MTMESRGIALLEKAGVTVNGPNPWDMQVHDKRLFGRVFRHGSLGLGEAYMDGWWDAPAVDQFICKVLRAGLEREVQPLLQKLALSIVHRAFNLQSKRRAAGAVHRHYDIGDELYERMLDPLRIYSCGYWKEAQTLEEAQKAKLELICQNLKLKRGMRVLDIGCGWGGLAKYMAVCYGVQVMGITLSVDQEPYARESCRGLPVEIRFQDYRSLNERFDRVVSVGMFEHVGYKNYRTYMQAAHRCLADDGLFLLHTIGGNISVTGPDPFIGKYIFPDGMLPSQEQIVGAIKGVFDVTEDWHNFGPYYDPTLMAWNDNFQAAWPELERLDFVKYDERFKRMWEYYLLSSAGSFRARSTQLWQIVLSPKGVPGGYESVR